MIHMDIHNQPDDETCGPTSLHAVYKYYGLSLSLDQVIQAVERASSGGTLASLLGKNALMQGFAVTLYVNNLIIFDPSWFHKGRADAQILIRKLSAQMRFKRGKKFIQATKAYKDFISQGGDIRFITLTLQLLTSFFEQNIPIITGLSATYLYQSPRERYTEDGTAFYDDIRGTPCGHFVVLCGFDEQKNIVVADPHRANPIAQNNYYLVDSQRLINAIMLGVLTFDANLLIIQPKKENHGNHNCH